MAGAERKKKLNTSQIPDDALIERFTAGDGDAINSLVKRHMPRVLAQAMRLSHDREVADDVVADTFVRMNRALPTFSGRSSFTTWLHTVTKNCYLDLRNRSISRATQSLDQAREGDSGPLDHQLVSMSETPYDLAERSARARALITAVERLPAGQQSLVVMFHTDMLSYEEISDRIRVPLGTVKSRLHRARRSLRVMLEADEFLLGVQTQPSRY